MKVIWSDRARDDVRNFRAYIARDNPRAANRQSSLVIAAGQRLGTFAHIGRIGRVAQSRELVVNHTPYIIVYQVIEDLVEIIAVLHSSQDWPKSF